MAQIKLNKSALSQERKKLQNYRQFLPSLDLKRLKILAEKVKAEQETEKAGLDVQAIENEISNKLPMAAVSGINIENLVKIQSVAIRDENVVGVKMPMLLSLKFANVNYPYFNTPPWFDTYSLCVRNLIEARLRHAISLRRLRCLDEALRTVTQRKNLFEKVLIPRSTNAIRYIQIFLADNERAAVVRSKIAKKKRQVT